MKKIVAVFTILVFVACSVFAADGPVGTDTPEGEVKVTLDLTSSESVNHAEVGFSSQPVIDFDSASPVSSATLNPNIASGEATLNEALYVYALIQYPEACTVTLSVPGGLMGYADKNKADVDTPPLESGVKLGWEITTNDDTTAEIKTDPIYAGGTRTAENLDAVVFRHDGTQATKAYSLPLTIRTDDYRGLEANYFAQYITVTVSAGSETP